MDIYLVMQNVKVNDSEFNRWRDNGTRPLSAHRTFDAAFDTIFEKYSTIRKQENVSGVDYKDGDECYLEYTVTEPVHGVQYKFEQWVSCVELKDEEALPHD